VQKEKVGNLIDGVYAIAYLNYPDRNLDVLVWWASSRMGAFHSRSDSSRGCCPGHQKEGAGDDDRGICRSNRASPVRHCADVGRL
jgi:hypothetical protein